MAGLLVRRSVREVSARGRFQHPLVGIFQRRQFRGLCMTFDHRQWHRPLLLQMSPQVKDMGYMVHMFWRRGQYTLPPQSIWWNHYVGIQDARFPRHLSHFLEFISDMKYTLHLETPLLSCGIVQAGRTRWLFRLSRGIMGEYFHPALLITRAYSRPMSPIPSHQLLYTSRYVPMIPISTFGSGEEAIVETEQMSRWQEYRSDDQLFSGGDPTKFKLSKA